MRIISFVSRKPGEAFVNGKKMNLNDLFILLQDPAVNTSDKEYIRHFLKTNCFNPNPCISLGRVVINDDSLIFVNGGMSFAQKIENISERYISHPNGWSKPILLTDEEYNLVQRARKRLKILTK